MGTQISDVTCGSPGYGEACTGHWRLLFVEVIYGGFLKKGTEKIDSLQQKSYLDG